jgi:membrane AbrB-like protein
MNAALAAKTTRDLAGLALAAVAGGACLGLVGVPAGWLSGAMLGVGALAAAGRATTLPPSLRQLAILISGVGMGSGLTPATLHTLARYPGSLAIMTVAVAAMVAVSFAILQRAPGFSRSTAFFSAIPGALSYVFIVAAPTGADMARIAVIQVFRLFVLMAIVPITAKASLAVAPLAFPTDPIAVTVLLIGLAAAAAWALARRGAAATGPLYAAIVISAIAHGLGWAPGRLAPGLQIAAQVLVGAWIGTRFVGFDWELLRRSLIPACASFLAAFAVAALCAGLAAWLVPAPFPEALAAFAPGGLEAMTMMAFALGLDPLFVGAHHIARFFLISATLPFLSRLFGVGRAPISP